MNAPMHTVATTYQCARGLSRTATGLLGSCSRWYPTDLVDNWVSSKRLTNPFQRFFSYRSKT